MARFWRTTISAVAVAAVCVVTPTAWNDVVSHAATRLPPGSPPSAITYAPVRPPHCTPDQIAAVDLDSCALMIDGTPAMHGFPKPPFPGTGFVTTPITADQWVPLTLGASGPIVTLLQEKLAVTTPDLTVDGKFGALTVDAVNTAQAALLLPVTGIVDADMATALGILVTAVLGPFPGPGWVWNGNSWSGSPALKDWEARFVKGSVKSDPVASPLFEGFLADIRRGNYRVDEAGTYAFRCTATTVRNCKGLDDTNLSYHAWGLAVDVNYTTNPLQVVHSATDACGAAAKHAMPDWVLKVAQHWGLFWGGWYYCPKAGQKSVVRDVHHFEFRGSPELALAIIAKNTAPDAAPLTVPGLADLLLSCGDRGPAVNQIRGLLPDAYRPVEAYTLRNTYTAVLADAVANWQRKNGLPPTGAFDPATSAAFGITPTHTEVFPVLHMNSCGDSVKALQAALGLTVTGTYGSATMAALRSWQSAHGLAPTGVTDTSTAAALKLKLATPPPPTTTTLADGSSTSGPPTSTTPGAKVMVPLGLGTRSSAVTTLQRALVAAGYPLKVDGRFGGQTAKALRAFLKANHLRVTTTLSLTAAIRLGLTPVPKLPMRSGQRGDNVLLLQGALHDLGVKIIVDGRFGAATRAAVKAFQKKVGLPQTGVVDAKTAKALGW